MDSKKVIFLNSWGESDKDLLERYSRQTPGNSGKWNGIEGTTNFNEADYYIILEGYSTILPQDKTIFVKREPNFINRHIPNYKHKILFNDTNCGQTWWIKKSYDELKVMKYPHKPKKISCVVSTKHSHRNNYVKSLFKNKTSIELYGRGHDVGYYGDAYKGELNYDDKCKLRGLIDYEYSIVLENSQQKNYWTEKMADAYLAWCLPIYCGCPNISDFFPVDSYYNVELERPEDITEVVKRPIEERHIEAMCKARLLILNKYNIWELIDKKIKILSGEIDL